MLMMSLFLLVACADDELKMLDVEFEVPETAEVDETITLKATVTYGDDPVTDPYQMDFEVWERGNRDAGDWIEANNHKDGTYTTEVTFDHDGIYEMYAHTTAHDLHTMPHREIIVGEGGEYDDLEDGFITEGFDMKFSDPEEIKTETDTELTVHLFIHDDMLENAEVRYEIWNDDLDDYHKWVDAEEVESGQYTAIYSFPEQGTYQVQVHVEDDEDLHEHKIYEIDVNE